MNTRARRVLVTTTTMALLIFAACSGGTSPTPDPSATTSPLAPSSPSASSSPTTEAPTTPSANPSPESPAPSPSVVSRTKSEGLEVVLIAYGLCTEEGGMFKIKGKGFTPGGIRWTLATTPAGDVYDPNLINNPGKISKDGSIPDWEWPCEGDTPGDYQVTIIDLSSVPHRSVSFTVTVHES